MTLKIPSLASSGEQKKEQTPLPADFQYASSRPGEIRRVSYPASDPGNPDTLLEKHAYVYLPYGYEDTPFPESSDAARYDILYFLHGSGKTAEDLIGGEGQPSVLKNILDNMIERGGIKPMIVVFPNIYPDRTALFSDLEAARTYALHFVQETETGLFPAVESRFRTFAETTDHDGLRASRTHRAFGGFSLGAVVTWSMFLEHLDIVSTFLPFSGDCWTIARSGGKKNPRETVRALASAARAAQSEGIGPGDYSIFCACGTEDTALPALSAQIAEMKKYRMVFQFSNDPDHGNLHVDFSMGGQHTYVQAFQYLYHALRTIFKV